MDSYNPDNNPFMHLPQVAALRTEHERFMQAQTLRLKASLIERGREKPVYPDDEDLMRWYEDCAQDSLLQYHRGMEDLRVAYMRGEL